MRTVVIIVPAAAATLDLALRRRRPPLLRLGAVPIPFRDAIADLPRVIDREGSAEEDESAFGLEGGRGGRQVFEDDPRLASEGLPGVPVGVAAEADYLEDLAVTAEEGEEASFEESLFDGPVDVAEVEGGVGGVAGLGLDFGVGGCHCFAFYWIFGTHGLTIVCLQGWDGIYLAVARTRVQLTGGG